MTIHGIPTLYNGARFRSRLEARWAAFFDLVGWKWDYEPFDLPGWIPDFIIHGDRERVLLVEVKPVGLHAYHDGEKEVFKHPTADLLLLGTGPQEVNYGTAIGRISQRGGGWTNDDDDPCFDHASFGKSYDKDVCWYSLCHASACWRDYITGKYNGDQFFPEEDLENAEYLWRLAGQRVQWNPRSNRESA